jgi:rubredoxin
MSIGPSGVPGERSLTDGEGSARSLRFGPQFAGRWPRLTHWFVIAIRDKGCVKVSDGLRPPIGWKCPLCGGKKSFPDPSMYGFGLKDGWSCLECSVRRKNFPIERPDCWEKESAE